ncbi:hypothetical protein IEO21_05778 [Rhodonia placenta]|uniref:uracil phosphoribosyltransferase n=1 Tax=Rhodonia placenta TaxID=104341 RepID=A0A8H7P1J2_9APHY|nr:hypothetical protein IEO21_05778 [Postia placenta]
MVAQNSLSSQTTPASLPPSVFTLPQTAQLEALYTIIRDKSTSRGDFLFYSDRIIRLLVEEGLNHLPVVPKTIETPTGVTYEGVGFEGHICGVSILRAGEAMEAGLREVCRSVRIGKILIQRDEETAQPKLFYSKLPQDIAQRYVLLLDPMLATGGSAMKAVEVIMEHGVPEERIIFINLIASPEGLRNFCTKYPALRVITGWIDQGLNEKSYIVPGLGDFGERRYGNALSPVLRYSRRHDAQILLLIGAMMLSASSDTMRPEGAVVDRHWSCFRLGPLGYTESIQQGVLHTGVCGITWPQGMQMFTWNLTNSGVGREDLRDLCVKIAGYGRALSRSASRLMSPGWVLCSSTLSYPTRPARPCCPHFPSLASRIVPFQPDHRHGPEHRATRRPPPPPLWCQRRRNHHLAARVHPPAAPKIYPAERASQATSAARERGRA